MRHLTSDELLDAVEGVLGAEGQAHLSSCEKCQRQSADLSNVLGEARQVSVPEPSPLFWQHFSQRVAVAIDAESSASGWPKLDIASSDAESEWNFTPRSPRSGATLHD